MKQMQDMPGAAYGGTASVDRIPPTRRRGRPSAEDSAAITDAILAAATKEFIANGFDGTAMESVAARAGVPKTTLYKRFADKAELMKAVLATRAALWERTTSVLHDRLPPNLLLRLRHYVATMIQWSTADEVRVFNRLARAAFSTSEKTFSLQQMSGYAEMVNRLGTDIAEYGPLLGIHAADPMKGANAVMTGVAGWLYLHDPGRPVGSEEAQAQAVELVDLVLHGSKIW